MAQGRDEPVEGQLGIRGRVDDDDLDPAVESPTALAPLIDWTSEMAGFWQKKFDDLEDLLKRMDQ